MSVPVLICLSWKGLFFCPLSHFFLVVCSAGLIWLSSFNTCKLYSACMGVIMILHDHHCGPIIAASFVWNSDGSFPSSACDSRLHLHGRRCLAHALIRSRAYAWYLLFHCCRYFTGVLVRPSRALWSSFLLHGRRFLARALVRPDRSILRQDPVREGGFAAAHASGLPKPQYKP